MNPLLLLLSTPPQGERTERNEQIKVTIDKGKSAVSSWF